jgi:peptidoglycan hydrolase FlgJ
MEKLANSSHFMDLGGLDTLRSQAHKDEKGALKEVAKQFEGIFVQMLMKSMRDANAVFKSDSPMNSQYTEFYEQMRDQQLSIDLSDKGMLGLADLMVQQLSPESSPVTPASVLRGNETLRGRVDGLGMPSSAQELDYTNPAPAMASVAEQIEKVTPGPLAASNPVPVPSAPITKVAEPREAARVDGPKTVDAILSGKLLPSAAPAAAKAPGFDSREDFVTRLYPHAQKAAKLLGTQPEVLIAQSALETGWGKKMIRRNDGEMSNNLFNIKADRQWKGAKTQVSTLEFEHGIAVKQKADFRIYDDIAQSFNDFVSFITDGERYQKAVKVAAEPEKFIRALQDAGYATDPQYANKVIQVMKSISSGLNAVAKGEK